MFYPIKGILSCFFIGRNAPLKWALFSGLLPVHHDAALDNKISLNQLVSSMWLMVCRGAKQASQMKIDCACNVLSIILPFSDKHVIPRALVQLRINCTCVLKNFPKLPSSLCDSGQFWKIFKTLVQLILNCTRPRVITYTYRPCGWLSILCVKVKIKSVGA